ncbi:MAG: FG-GAP-like repeat-containing protein [Desulfosalsimonas sp.]
MIFAPGIWAQDRTIAVFPFEVHGTEDSMNMEKAAADMFSSRLEKVPGFTIIADSRLESMDIDPADMSLDNALAAGLKLDADIVLYGSLTMLGESWSMDASLADVAKQGLIDSFSSSGASRKELIPGVEDMAKDMGKALKETEIAQKPEKSAKSDEPESPYAGFKAAEPERKDIAGAWSGPEMDRNFTGIAAADITGDGRTETVLVDKDTVYIYTISDRDFILTEKIAAPSNTVCMAVDAADINDNGKAEIFVTSANNRNNMLRSFVLEYKDGGFEVILEKSPWFYRVVSGQDNQPMLLGQRHRTGADPFASEIVRINFKNGEYSPGKSFIDGDNEINVLGFAPGSIKNRANKSGAVAFDNTDRLIVLDPEGKTAWESGRRYGGISLFLEGIKQGKGEAPERFYLPGRILTAGIDSNPDNPDRIFLFKNTNPSPVNLKRLRVYTKGEILSLAWDGAGLREEWKTREYDGHFRDICLADLTGDGSTELAALLTEKQSWTPFSESRSRVLVFPVQDTVK